MSKAIFALCVFMLVMLPVVSAQSEYVAIKPSEKVVRPGAQIPFSAAYFKNGQAQLAMPLDFRFSAPKGSFNGNVYIAPDKPGTYLVFVHYRKSMGLAMVTVKSAREITKIEILPREVTLAPGESISFQAKVYGKNGNTMAFLPAWGAKGGKVDQDGNFRAGKKTGTYTVVAWGPKGIKATASIRIAVAAKPVLRKLQVLPQSSTVQSGDRLRFLAKGYDQYDKPIRISVRWSATGGVIDANGNFTAGDKPGSYRVIARVGGIENAAKVKVKPASPVLTELRVFPRFTEVLPGGKRRFRATGLDQYGKQMSIKVRWSAKGGKIDQNGEYVAGDLPGRYEVTAAAKNLRTRVSLKIKQAPAVLASLKIEPKSARVQAKGKLRFVVKALDQYGKQMSVKVKWSAGGGKIDQNGKYVAANFSGKYDVIAVVGKLRATARVTVERAPAVLTSLKIEPKSAKVQAKGKLRFVAKGFDQYGKPIDIKVQWSCQGGNFRDDNFLAGDSPGSYRVTAKAVSAKGNIDSENDGVLATATVIVISPPRFELVVTPKHSVVKPGEKVSFEVKLYRDKREQGTFPWEFTFVQSGGNFEEGVYTAPEKPGIYQIKIRHPRATATAIVEVKKIEIPVVLPKAAEIRIEPSGKIELFCGKTSPLRATVLDREGNVLKRQLQWIIDGGNYANGAFTAGQKPGNYSIVVTEPKSRLTREISIVVKKAPSRYRMEITPSRLILAPGEKRELQIKLYQGVHEIPIFPWEIQAKTTGGVFENDVYTAPLKTGEFKITIIHDYARAEVLALVRREKISRMAVTPEEITVKPGERIRFQANLFNDKGDQVHGLVVWHCTGGVITQQGAFTAGKQSGSYTVEAIHEKISAKAKVVVHEQRGLEIKVDPSEIVVAPGEKVDFRVTVFKNGEHIWVLPFEIIGIAPAGSFQDTVYRSPEKEGRYRVIFVYRQAKGSAQIVVKGKKGSEIVRMAVVPEEVRLKPGQAFRFKAFGYDNRGEAVTPFVKWQATGGKISETGKYRAGRRSGTFEVKAIHGDVMATAKVKVTTGILRLAVIPSRATLHPREKKTFKAIAYMEDGKEKEVKVTWTASGGKINSRGVFVADDVPGNNYSVQAYYLKGGLRGFASIKIEKFPQPAFLRIKPKNVVLSCGHSQQFSVKGFDKDGNEVPVIARWVATGGTITPKGLYQAGQHPGRFTISIMDTRSDLFVEIPVQIIPAREMPLQEGYTLKVYPGNRVISPGENIYIEPVLFEGGQRVWLSPREFRYSATSGIFIGEYDNVWLAPSIPGLYTITVSCKYAASSITMTVARDFRDAVSRLEISPAEITLAPGKTCHFRCTAYNGRGEETQGKIKWSAVGGTIDQEGNFHAGDVPGRYRIDVRLLTRDIQASARVIIAKKTPNMGYRWGKMLRQRKITRDEMIDFFCLELFFQPIPTIRNFQSTCAKGYGPGGKRQIGKMWAQAITSLGRYYGINLYRNGISQQDLVDFLREYVLRLLPQERESFKTGFIYGYGDTDAVYVYRRLWNRAKRLSNK